MKNHSSESGAWPSSPATFVEVARVLHPQRTVKGAGDRVLFVLRSLRSYGEARAWYSWLAEPLMAPAVRANPALYKKIIRPYLTPGCSNAQKLRMMQEHYVFMSSVLTRSAFLQACSFAGLPLLSFSAHGERFQVLAVSDGKYRKEGEVTLALHSETRGIPVSTLTFLITRGAAGRVLVIGGTQGLPKRIDKSVIKEVTKALHGLRPRALLLFVAQELASAWQLDGIRATSNTTHVSRHLDYSLNQVRRPKLAYDEFWQESGGTLNPDGFYDLPARYAPREASTIKANKRSLYSQRYALLDALAGDLERRLSSLLPPESRRVIAPRRMRQLDDSECSHTSA